MNGIDDYSESRMRGDLKLIFNELKLNIYIHYRGQFSGLKRKEKCVFCTAKQTKMNFTAYQLGIRRGRGA